MLLDGQPVVSVIIGKREYKTRLGRVSRQQPSGTGAEDGFEILKRIEQKIDDVKGGTDQSKGVVDDKKIVVDTTKVAVDMTKEVVDAAKTVVDTTKIAVDATKMAVLETENYAREATSEIEKMTRAREQSDSFEAMEVENDGPSTSRSESIRQIRQPKTSLLQSSKGEFILLGGDRALSMPLPVYADTLSTFRCQRATEFAVLLVSKFLPPEKLRTIESVDPHIQRMCIAQANWQFPECEVEEKEFQRKLRNKLRHERRKFKKPAVGTNGESESDE